MKYISLLILSGALIFIFQNCGETARNSGILAQSEQFALQAEECPTGICEGQEAGLLWLQIQENNPLRVHYNTASSHVMIGGFCGTGIFTRHSFFWQLREGYGTQEIVGEGFSDDICLSGVFSLKVSPTRKNIVPDQRYTLEVELVGITDEGQQLSNPSPANLGSLDIVFESEQPQ